MELQPVGAGGPRLIDGYRTGGFTVGGERFEGALLLGADGPVAWAAGSDMAALDEAAIEALEQLGADHDLVLIGTGNRLSFLSKELRLRLRAAGLQTECMTTHAACRTFNVLLGEGRAVAAALLPLGDEPKAPPD